MGVSERCAIAVMAKAPRPGRVKTRLVPPLSADQAMAMSAAFLRDVTENIALAGRSAPIDGWIAYAPACEAALFDGLVADGTQLLLADGAADMPAGVSGFGACLLQTVRELLARGYRAACVLNADSPTLPTAHLVRLANLLTEPGERAVLGASDDGGYYVLGMRSPHHRLFADIAWSSEQVAAQTRARAREAGVALTELPPWYDVDDAAMLRRLLSEISTPQTGSPAPYAAPATCACIRQLGLDRHHAVVA